MAIDKKAELMKLANKGDAQAPGGGVPGATTGATTPPGTPPPGGTSGDRTPSPIEVATLIARACQVLANMMPSFAPLLRDFLQSLDQLMEQTFGNKGTGGTKPEQQVSAAQPSKAQQQAPPNMM